MSEPEKQLVARELTTETNSYISTQVLTELTNTLTRKFKLSYLVALTAIDECAAPPKLRINTGSPFTTA